MRIGIPAEVHHGERRVAVVPDTAVKLQKQGFEVCVQSGAGNGAHISDADYEAAGCTIVADADTLWGESDLVLKVRAPDLDEFAGKHELDRMTEGTALISLIFPTQAEELLGRLQAKKATAIALDQVPRISRAQKMDVLSSMANMAGYRAVVEASNLYPGFFAGQMTAAGRSAPARVLVIGAGVAGLAAIAAARGLGAEVRAFDVRPAAKEQVESLGARFLMLDFEESGEGTGGYAKTMSKEFIDAEMALFREQAKEVDIVITTALIPGKRAPILWTEDMVSSMKKGSVVVDLAAEQGGNVEGTIAGEVVDKSGVNIVGYTDLASRMASTASRFFGNNIAHLLDDLGGAEFNMDFEDEVVRKATVVHEGRLTWPPPPDPPPEPKPAPTPVASPEPQAAPAATPSSAEAASSGGISANAIGGLLLAVLLTVIGLFAPTDFIQHFTVFVLACFVGWQVVWNVTAALHTPLMSVTNAISGIIIVGGLLQAGRGEVNLAGILGAIAILVASINIFGGFLVTQRMLAMFRRGPGAAPAKKKRGH